MGSRRDLAALPLCARRTSSWDCSSPSAGAASIDGLAAVSVGSAGSVGVVGAGLVRRLGAR